MMNMITTTSMRMVHSSEDLGVQIKSANKLRYRRYHPELRQC